MATGRTVDDLADLVGRPPEPPAVVPWAEVEARVGHPLPADYRRLVEVFGSGVFDSYVGITSPVQSERHLDRFLDQARQKLELVREWNASPHPVLVPWASAGEGCSLFLLPDGDVAVCDDECSVWERHPGPVSGFLVDLFTGRLGSDLLPFEPRPRHRFSPDPVGTRPAPAPVPVDPGRWRLFAPLTPVEPRDAVAGLVELTGYDGPGRTTDWAAVERAHGITFPADYKRLVDTFGAARFGAVRVHAPGAPHDLDRLVAEVRARVLADRPVPGDPYHPEPGGLVPWGRTDSGRVLFWVPSVDDPDAWPVLSAPWGFASTEPHFRTATGLLLAHLTGAEPNLPDPLGTGPHFTPEGNGEE